MLGQGVHCLAFFALCAFDQLGQWLSLVKIKICLCHVPGMMMMCWFGWNSFNIDKWKCTDSVCGLILNQVPFDQMHAECVIVSTVLVASWKSSEHLQHSYPSSELSSALLHWQDTMCQISWFFSLQNVDLFHIICSWVCLFSWPDIPDPSLNCSLSISFNYRGERKKGHQIHLACGILHTGGQVSFSLWRIVLLLCLQLNFRKRIRAARLIIMEKGTQGEMNRVEGL